MVCMFNIQAHHSKHLNIYQQLQVKPSLTDNFADITAIIKWLLFTFQYSLRVSRRHDLWVI